MQGPPGSGSGPRPAALHPPVASREEGIDLTVSLVNYSVETNGALRVIAQVQNLGAPAATNSVLSIRRADGSGSISTSAILATVGVASLEPGRLAQVALDLPPATQPQGDAWYQLRTDETQVVADVNPNNNTTTFAVNLWVDSDGDGIPDWWMMKYFGHPTGLASDHSRALDDADGDGMSNRAEYLAGTDPRDPRSSLRINSIAVGTTSGVRVAWGSTPYHLYARQRASALPGSGSNFINLVEHIFSTPPENTLIDLNATNSPSFLYRLKVE